MAVDMEALASGMNEEIKRQSVVLQAYMKRIAELEAALREAHAAVPGGSICDPQRVADDIRAIADRVGVELQH